MLVTRMCAHVCTFSVLAVNLPLRRLRLPYPHLSMELLDSHPPEKIEVFMHIQWRLHLSRYFVAEQQFKLHNPVRATIKNQRGGYAKQGSKNDGHGRFPLSTSLVFSEVGDGLGTLSNTDRAEGSAPPGMGCL